MTTYNLADFDIVSSGTLVAEASTINYRGCERIYDDACDVGIAIRSHHTGRVVRFYLVNQDKRHGDIAGWRFAPCPEDRPCCNISGVLIIND